MSRKKGTRSLTEPLGTSHSNLCLTELMQIVVGVGSFAKSGTGRWCSLRWAETRKNSCAQTASIRDPVSAPASTPETAMDGGWLMRALRKRTAFYHGGTKSLDFIIMCFVFSAVSTSLISTFLVSLPSLLDGCTYVGYCSFVFGTIPDNVVDVLISLDTTA